MDKYRIEIDWLNKLYDDIYYNELDESEHALDIITSLIADKESKPIVNENKNLVTIIIEISEDLADLFDSEDLTECHNFIIDKIDQVQNRELDDTLREEYFPELYDLEEDTELSTNDLDNMSEEIVPIDEETISINEVLEEELKSDDS